MSDSLALPQHKSHLLALPFIPPTAMGSMLSGVFIDPALMTGGQLCWTFLCYLYPLFTAANLISDGSELLLLIPEAAGIVGSIVLPVLCAVPDGIMVLFSGLGPLERAQERVSVGVGTLAGSTIMLLTLPWFLAIVAGRVDIVDGRCSYKRKLTRWCGLLSTGVACRPQIMANARIMAATSATYLAIQLPSLLVDDQKPDIKGGLAEIRRESRREHVYALLGLFICAAEFVGYLVLQYRLRDDPVSTEDIPLRSPASDTDRSRTSTGFESLITKEAFTPVRRMSFTPEKMAESALKYGIQPYVENFRNANKQHEAGNGLHTQLVAPRFDPEFKKVLGVLYSKYARAKLGAETLIGFESFAEMCRDLGLANSSDSIRRKFIDADANGDGHINSTEFLCCFEVLANSSSSLRRPQGSCADRYGSREQAVKPEPGTGSGGDGEGDVADDDADADGDDDEDDTGEVEMPDDFKSLPPAQQRRCILRRSFAMMGFGTLVILLFSDPMVDLLGEIGRHVGVSPFYVSFILSPLASNAGELVAAYNYARQKTSKTITISLSQLEGAACMNNTFCLGIFLALIYFQGLAWKFTAETAATLLAQVVMFVLVSFKSTHTLLDGLFVLLLYPLSLLTVYKLEEAGYD